MASSRVIGLDIGTTAVRAAELEFGNGGPAGPGTPTLVRYGQVALPAGVVRDGEAAEPSIVSDALRQLWTQAKFGSKDVVIGVGNQRVVVRELDLPWMPLPQLKASLPFQVQEMLPVSVDEALLDYYPTHTTDGPQGRTVHGMLVAAQRDTVTANVVAVEGAGLHPAMVDLNAFAIVRALARGDLAQRVVGFVDIGARLTNVVVANQGVPRLVRIIPMGGDHITDALASALHVGGPEAEQHKRQLGVGYAPPVGQEAAAEVIAGTSRTLVESIRNTLVYYAGNHPGQGIDVVVVTGGGAHLLGLGQYLSSASRLPVVLGDALAGLRFAKATPRESLVGLESLVALPVGLAYGVAA